MNKNNTPHITVVVPVYNEAQGLRELYGRLTDVLQNTRKDYEIIFVDDGSLDKSGDILKDLGEKDAKIKLVSFCRNFGQHAAVMAGFNEASGKIIVTLDADLQNPPEEIPQLVKKIEEGYDVACGMRRDRKDKLLRRIPSLMMNIIISRLTGIKLSDYGCMLRAYNRHIIRHLLKYGEKSVYIPAFASWLTGNVAEIPVRHDARKYGKSKYSLLKFLRQAFDLITAYTLLPIQLISITGAIFSLAGFFLACYLISFRFFFGTTNTLTTFISALLLFSGIIILFMGIISEYIARIYIESRKKPLYILKEEFDNSRGEKQINEARTD